MECEILQSPMISNRFLLLIATAMNDMCIYVHMYVYGYVRNNVLYLCKYLLICF